VCQKNNFFKWEISQNFLKYDIFLESYNVYMYRSCLGWSNRTQAERSEPLCCQRTREMRTSRPRTDRDPASTWWAHWTTDPEPHNQQASSLLHSKHYSLIPRLDDEAITKQTSSRPSRRQTNVEKTSSKHRAIRAHVVYVYFECMIP